MKKRRVTFDFSEQAYEDLSDLQHDTKAISKADVVRQALWFYKLHNKLMGEGYSLIYKKGNEEREVEITL